MATGIGGRGLTLTSCGSRFGLQYAIDPDFLVPPNAERQEAGFVLAKRLIDLGIKPMLDQENEIVKVFEIGRLNEAGVVGRGR